MSYRVKIELGEIADLGEGLGEIPLLILDRVCWGQENLELVFQKYVEDTKQFISEYFKKISEEEIIK